MGIEPLPNQLRRAALAAVILSAGRSSRLPRFKPLLPLGGPSMLGRAALLFQEAGIRDIVAVTGNRADEVAAEARRYGMRPVHNPAHEQGMFSSALAGIRSLPPEVEGFFILPVDIPLVRPVTIRLLLDRFARSEADVLYPTFKGERGHPPLLSGRCRDRVLSYAGDDGLRGALADAASEAVPVPDEHILFDVDTDAAYAEAESRMARWELPSRDEAEALLAIAQDGNERGLAHARLVTAAALAMGHALLKAGLSLDLGLVESAALLHDVAKGRPDHEREGGRLLAELGFGALSPIVAAHRDIVLAEEEPITEREVVFLADKLAQCNRFVTARERYGEKMRRFRDDPEAVAAIAGRLANALAVQERVERAAGRDLGAILGEAGLAFAL